MVRVAGSSSPAARMTWPANVRPGYSRTVTLPETPGRTPGATSWGTCTKTRAGSIAAILKSGWLLPAVTNAPISIVRCVMVPANGAVTLAKALS